MKNFSKHITILLITIFSANFAISQQAKVYAVKSGHITYELTGNTTGTKELWWDNYGNTEYELINSKSVTKMFGITNEEVIHTETYTFQDEMWSINHIDGTAYHGELPYYDSAHEITDDMTEAEQEEYAENVLNSLGGQKSGEEEFLGKMCEVYNIWGAKSWIYKGVILKSTAKILGIEANETAIEFEENISIPRSKLTAPEMEYEPFPGGGY